jgi:hypothetical protein
MISTLVMRSTAWAWLSLEPPFTGGTSIGGIPLRWAASGAGDGVPVGAPATLPEVTNAMPTAIAAAAMILFMIVTLHF